MTWTDRPDLRAELASALREPGVVVCVGPAGSGKTTLARRAASSHEGALEVSCGSASDAEGVWVALARALDVVYRSAGQISAAVAALSPSLVFLDEVEHLREVIPPIIEALSTAPTRVLVTSRAEIAVPSVIVEVGPMKLPDSPSHIVESESGKLLIQSIREVVPGWTIDPKAEQEVFRLLKTLDGLPLAIVLAGRRLSRVGVHDLNALLEAHLSVLSDRSTSGRHQSLTAALDASWDELDVRQKEVLDWLCRMWGRIDDAVIAPIGVGSDMLDALALECWLHPEGDAYRMLHPLRMFIRERCRSRAEDDVQKRFDAWVADRAWALTCEGRSNPAAHDALPDLRQNVLWGHDRALEGSDGRHILHTGRAAQSLLMIWGPVTAMERRLERTLRKTALHDDPECWVWTMARWGRCIARPEKLPRLRAAIDEASAAGVNVDVLEVARVACRVVEDRVQGAAEAERVLETLETVEAKATCARLWVMALGDSGEPERAVEAAEQGIRLAREAGRDDLEGVILRLSGLFRIDAGDWEGGAKQLEFATELLKGAGEQAALAHRLLSVLAQLRGDVLEARRQADAARQGTERVGGIFRGACLARYADLHEATGDLDAALPIISRALELTPEATFGARSILLCQRARVLAAQGRIERARVDFDEAVRLGQTGHASMNDMRRITSGVLQTLEDRTHGRPSVEGREVLAAFRSRRRTPDVELVFRILEGLESSMHPGPVLVFNADGTVDLGEEPVVLHGANLRIVQHLGATRDSWSTVDDLARAGWPGSELMAESASARVYQALSVIRRAGLRAHIERGEAGWRLNPASPAVSRGVA